MFHLPCLFLFSRIIKRDSPPSILHCFAGRSHEEFMKIICETEDIFQKAKFAVKGLLVSVTKHDCIERMCPSPLVLGKLQAESENVLHRLCNHRGRPGKSLEEIHVSLQWKLLVNSSM